MAAAARRSSTCPQGGRLVSYAEGVMATVSVVEDARGVATLHINNRQQEGSSATLLADARQALLPMLLHPAPHRALFLGLGTGRHRVCRGRGSGAASRRRRAAAGGHRGVRVLHGARRPSDAPNPRLRVIAADARRFVRSHRARYDVIVADNFHPARSGSGSLYTVEHFAAVRERLAAGRPVLPMAAAASARPRHAAQHRAQRSCGVIRRLGAARDQQPRYAGARLDRAATATAARRSDGVRDATGQRCMPSVASLEDFGIGDELALLGSFVAGPQRARARSPPMRRSTPTTVRSSPIARRASLTRRTAPRDRLLELLER